METKICRECQEDLPLVDFYAGSSGKPVMDCKSCYNRKSVERHRADRAKNPEKWKRRWASRQRDPRKVKSYNLMSRFGFDIETYDEILDIQGGGCAICGQQDEDEYLHVDHDHETGRVRGLLCGPCNRGLGLFADSQERLVKAAGYLLSGEKVVQRVGRIHHKR